ncbi:hypothetical protein SDC9_172833 [bioreactor metagenome]|uniref:Uncharacterized protein n=1 Tax=bioreactor metagenome TaxID=1076179 RepID=A0A645GN89_9ZZZZ
MIFYQKALIKLPGQKSFSIQLNYDFDKYFRDVYINEYSKLQKVENVLFFDFEDIPDDFIEYAERVLIYGRGVGNYQHMPTEKIKYNVSIIGA